jgi:ubiquinone/menaquinone biosynthesis C-methylase UbiE
MAADHLETQEILTSQASKQLVEQGYDAIAPRYLDWISLYSSPRTAYISKLLHLIPKNAFILELGCGAGLQCTKMLAEHSKNVTANDISGAQIDLAKGHAPGVTFVRSDMMGLEFEERSFDAVAAFYSVIHLPRNEQEVILKRVWGWLREGGYLLVNLGVRDSVESVRDDCKLSGISYFGRMLLKPFMGK